METLPIKRMQFVRNNYIPIGLYPTEILLGSGVSHGLRIEMFLTIEKRIRVVFKEYGLPREYLYQALRLVQAVDREYPDNIFGIRGEFVLTWSVSPGHPEFDVRLHSGGQQLQLASRTAEPFILRAGDDIQLAIEPVFPGLKPPRLATPEEKQFLFEVTDLDAQFNQAESDRLAYDYTKGAAALYHLLVDDGGLAPGLAKRNGVKLEFAVRDYDARLLGTNTANPAHESITLSVDRLPTAKRKYLNWNEFMAYKAQQVGDTVVTVRHVIQAVANGKGGRHSKLRASKVEQKTLLEYDSVYFESEVDFSLTLVFHIGRTTLKALEPLVEAIIARYRE